MNKKRWGNQFKIEITANDQYRVCEKGSGIWLPHWFYDNTYDNEFDAVNRANLLYANWKEGQLSKKVVEVIR